MPINFSVIDEGVIFRTADGLQGYYPRVVRLSEHEFLASVVAGVAIESPDSHPELVRSTDGGKTWEIEGPVDCQSLNPQTATETGFISPAPGGGVFCFGSRFPLDPADLGRPLVHPETLGMAANEPVLRRSSDDGRTWTPPVVLPKPYPVPLETPTGIVALADGTLIFSCSTWRHWNGDCPYGHRVTMQRSTDGGQTWSGPIDIFHDPSDRLGFWEGRVTQLTATELIATCWAHDWQTDEDVENRYARSHDAGQSWEPYRTTPVRGQTGWPMRLDDTHVLFVYNHRRPPVGVRAQIVDVSTGWDTVYDGEVWTPEDRRIGEIVKGEYAVTGFQFGAPSAICLDDDTFMAVYWCVVGGRAGINYTIGKLS